MGCAAITVEGFHIEGLKRTAAITVMRELPFHHGSIWQDNYRVKAERRLRNLGIFSEVVVSAPDEQGVVHIRLKERWTLWMLPQGGGVLIMVLHRPHLWWRSIIYGD